MSKISDMYEQIKLLEDTLIKTKLQEAVKAIKEKRELSVEERHDYEFLDDDFAILQRILEEQGIEENVFCWIQPDYDIEYEYCVMKIDGDYIRINPCGDMCITNIESIREELAYVPEDYWGATWSEEQISREVNAIANLIDIDLEQLKPRIQEKMPDEPEVTFEEDDYEYEDDYDYDYDDEHDEWDDNGYDVRRYQDGRIEVRYYDDEGMEIIAEYGDGEYDDIWFTLRNAIPYNAPEEQIAITLNSISTEELEKYFELYPEDIELFEQMRSKYPDIQSLAEREAEEHSAGDEFVANIVDYATKKVEVREQNAQAAQLAQDYEQQLPANEQSLDD